MPPADYDPYAGRRFGGGEDHSFSERAAVSKAAIWLVAFDSSANCVTGLPVREPPSCNATTLASSMTIPIWLQRLWVSLVVSSSMPRTKLEPSDEVQTQLLVGGKKYHWTCFGTRALVRHGARKSPAEPAPVDVIDGAVGGGSSNYAVSAQEIHSWWPRKHTLINANIHSRRMQWVPRNTAMTMLRSSMI